MAELRDALWKAADKLRGATDAAHYKDYVLGLVFLRYAMDGGRWDELAARAAGDDIGVLLDAAMDEIAAASPALDAALPRPFGAGGVDQRRLAGLIAPHRGHSGERHPARRARRGLRVLPGEVRPRRGQARRRVLHARQRRPAAGRGAGAVRGPGLRPVLRLGRHVRPGGEVRPRPPGPPRRHRGLRPGVQRAHLAPGQDEPRHPRHHRRPEHPLGGHLLRRQAPRPQGRLHPRQPAVQHVRLGARDR